MIIKQYIYTNFTLSLSVEIVTFAVYECEKGYHFPKSFQKESISFFPALMPLTLFSIYCLVPTALSLPLGPPLWSQYRYDPFRIGATNLRAGPSTAPTEVFSFLSGDLNSIDGSSAIASDGK